MAQNKKRKGTNPKRNQICSRFNNGMDKKTTIINNRIESRNKKMIQGKKSVPKSLCLQIPTRRENVTNSNKKFNF